MPGVPAPDQINTVVDQLRRRVEELERERDHERDVARLHAERERRTRCRLLHIEGFIAVLEHALSHNGATQHIREVDKDVYSLSVTQAFKLLEDTREFLTCLRRGRHSS